MALSNSLLSLPAVCLALVLAVSWISESVAVCPDHIPVNTRKCPKKNPNWTTPTGVPGVIVTKRGQKKRQKQAKKEWANDTISEVYYYGKGWGGFTGGVPDAATCYNLCQTFNWQLCLNGAHQRCAYWTYDGKQGDCWLFDCTACKGKKSFKSPNNSKFKKSVSGAGPQSCGKEDPDVIGDPHFTGADSSHFDFSGVPNTNYCLVSDSHLHINVFFGGRYGEYEGNPHKSLTWIRKVGILWAHHTILFEGRSGARWQYDNGYMASMEVDGQKVLLAQVGDVARFFNGAVEIEWVGARERSGDDDIDTYKVTISGVMELVMRLRPEVEHLRTPEDGTVHFNLDFISLSVSHNAHGVLGQTYRLDHQGKLADQRLEYNELLKADVVPGDNAEGFLDGAVEDYQTSGILGTDCKIARFARFKHFDVETSQILEFLSKTSSAVSTMGGSTRKVLNGVSTSVTSLFRKRR